MKYAVALLLLGFAWAVPAAPMPICSITAEVASVEHVQQKINSMFGEKRRIEYYSVKLNIENYTTQEYVNGRGCDWEYISRSKESKIIVGKEEYEANPFYAGGRISGSMQFRGDEWFSGYFLSVDNVIDKGKGPGGACPLAAALLITGICAIASLRRDFYGL
ncbi:MAG: hypothetical protein QW035_02100 [Candidatus Anstonellales archaeon]